MQVRVSRTAQEHLDALPDEFWFEAWKELRRLQRGRNTLQCAAGQFGNHWCASGNVGFRVSMPDAGLALIWHLIP